MSKSWIAGLDLPRMWPRHDAFGVAAGLPHERFSNIHCVSNAPAPVKPFILRKMRRLLRIRIFAKIVWISCFSSALCNLLHTLTVWLDGVGRWQLPTTDQCVL